MGWDLTREACVCEVEKGEENEVTKVRAELARPAEKEP
jgi:hypothetical protein